MSKFFKKVYTKKSVLALLTFVYTASMSAQKGAAGIQAAASEIKSYMDSLTTLSYAIGAIVGVIGGIRIYVKWSNGEEVNKDLLGWGGAFIFLMVVPTVVKAFFT
ncbi:MAG: DUF4134 domain-containing protein [Prevotella sp.]|jgi:hypothetical protein|nr:DUF4134 domain-containing protein [Prevotella sp.]